MGSPVRKRAAADLCPTPPKPSHGAVDCTPSDELGIDIYCIFHCDNGYKFKDTTETEIIYVCDTTAGFFEDPKPPPCVAVCNPPCRNGGKCVSPNQCDCVPPYHGPQCIHSRQLCIDPKPPRFGQMQCSSDGNGGKICVPHCLPTFKFETAPPAQYVCGKNGTWSPDVNYIPDCIQETHHTTTSVTMPVTQAVRKNEAMCASWGKDHFRTFDSKVFSFQGNCRYVLASVPNSFEIMVSNDPQCSNGGTCFKEVHIFENNNEIRLQRGSGGLEVMWNNQVVSIPGAREGTFFRKVGNYLAFISSQGYNIKWDGRQSVFIKVSEDFKNSIHGLCGKYNGDRMDEFETKSGQIVSSVEVFGNSWKATDVGKVCQDVVQPRGCLGDIAKAKAAEQKCLDLQVDPSFSPCHNTVDPADFIESCKTDCCNAQSDSCMCSTFEAYSRACADKGVKLAWRAAGRCDIQCPGSQIYKECGSTCIRDCKDPNPICSDSTCVDGCFCPDGTVMQNGQCILKAQCPCEHSSKTYQPGEKIQRQCNTCTCNAGSWSCTQKTCAATCSATGDPHLETFDRKRYNFMGTCSYYLMKDRDFSVIADNIECGRGTPPASCTKSISVDINGINIKLDHNHQVFINGREITNLPYEAPGIKISMVSSLFMQAKLSNGVTILWDGRTRAYIKAPESFMHKTIGMCGTFDGNQANDFMTPEGNVETNPNAFGNRWKTETSCRDVPLTSPPDPCDANPHKKDQAAKLCSTLKSDIFKACHIVEDVQSYYEDCVYDLCACTENMKDCMCPNIGSYADTCASMGVSINWRLQVTECMLQCAPGQEYMVCSNPCERTCQDIANNTEDYCEQKCVEGCNCPDGQTLNDEGICVPISSCPCMFDGRQYPAGYTSLKGTEICVCTDGKFKCSRISFTDGDSLQRAKPLCDDNSVYSDCVSHCPMTCENQHSPPSCSNADCQPGCECLPGFVREENKCVNATTCPCHHGGKAYLEGEKYTMDCNECTCIGQKWQCEQKSCPSTCSAYGDSHYTTFDGRHYEFQGNCDYILVQNAPGAPVNFTITTKNTQCGSSGVTCTKQLELIVGNAGTDNFYSLQLVQGQSVVADPRSPFKVKEVGDMVYITTPFGVTLQWDKGNRVYVRLSTNHISKVQGLCGNFNQNENDDFTPRQGGFPLVKPTLFGDSWKAQQSCGPSQEITDTCQSNPQRKKWSQTKCSVLSSDLFEPCHNLVDHTKYMERCVFDACACDFGGDCECLCTAIAAYAHECAVRGVMINWRSNDLCPVQCEECEVYNPCISLCPKKTCDNRLIYNTIDKDCEDSKGLCFEGCDLHKCPEGQVYDSLTDPVTCIPEALCETTACEINGKKYREGERVEDEKVCRAECEICICRNGLLDHITFGSCDPIPVNSETPSPNQNGNQTPTPVPPNGPSQNPAERSTQQMGQTTNGFKVTNKGI